MKDIVLVWDFDLTLSEEYQQIPLFKDRFEQIKKQGELEDIEINNPYDYFKRCDNMGGEKGISYLQRMIWDSQKNGCFEGLSLDDLFNYGKKVKPVNKVRQGLEELKKEFKNHANVHHYVISVGIKNMIQGFLEENELENLIEGINASEFHTDENGVINGIKNAIVPFNKNQPLIEIMKGNPKLLNELMHPEEYKYSYRNLIVVGDGFSDVSKFAYSKKKGGTPVCVYKKKDVNDFNKGIQGVLNWVDYILPRDYNPKKQTIDVLKEIIENKIKQKCNYSPEPLYNYNKGKIKHPDEQKSIEEHLKNCSECSTYFKKVLVTPNNVKTLYSSQFL